MGNNKGNDSKTNLVIFILAIGLFVVGTVELGFAGILKVVSSDLGISIAATGQLVTIYAIIYAIGTPVFTLITSRIERKKLLLLSLIVFILSNVIATVSPNYLILMSSRIIGAISSGIFSVSSVALAAKIVPSSQVGKAIGRTMMGYTASLVLGVPFGTFVGETFGWRIIFALVALVSLLPLAGVWLFVQKAEREEPVPFKTQFSIMRNPAMVMGMLVTVFILTGQFSLYTYLTPFLHALADFHTEGITASFFVLGIFGVLGSFIGGNIVDKLGARKTAFGMIGGRILAFFILPLVVKHHFLLFLIMMVWSTAGWATTPAILAYLRTLAPKMAQVIISVNASFMQLGIALGSTLGGLIISSHYSYASLSWSAGFLSIFGLISFIFSITISTRQSNAPGK